MKYTYAEDVRRILSVLDHYIISREDIVELILAMKYVQASLPIPETLHLRLVDLYCRSSGLIQELIHRLRLGSRKSLANQAILRSDRFSMTALQFTDIIHEVVNQGYAVLPFSLSHSETQSILSKSFLFSKYNCVNLDGSRQKCSNHQLLFSGTNELVAAYANEDELLSDDEIISLIYDPILISIFSFLLGAPAILRHVSLWHSFPNHEPSSEAAQLFHFDLDEFKWFKLFIFLTDVDEYSGPHVYIPGTHRVGSKPFELLNYGYTRIPDELMTSFYPASSWQKITCKSGTMVIANTSCWHKGTPVLSTRRSVLQPEYSLSTFSKSLA